MVINHITLLQIKYYEKLDFGVSNTKWRRQCVLESNNTNSIAKRLHEWS